MVDKDKFADEDAQGYKLTIVGKNIQLTEPMRQHVADKLDKVERFHQHIMDVHVTLEIQREEHVCVIVCHFNHFKVKVEARTTDMYASIDKAVTRLQQQFGKWKGKIQDYQRKPGHLVDLSVNVYRRHESEEDELEEINREIESAPKKEWVPHEVIAKEVQVLKTLTTEQAIMKMELSGDAFMLYKDEQEGTLKLIYRREDDHYGVIQAEG